MRENTDVVSAAGSFIQDLAASGASPKTVELRRFGLDRFCRHCAAGGIGQVQDITLTVLEAYRSDLRRQKLADATVEQYLRAPRLLLDRLERHGEIFENPARRMALHRRPMRLPRVPTEIQVRTLLEQPPVDSPTGRRDRALLEFLYGTGARVSEALGTDVADLDPVAGTVRLLGKGRRERMCPLGVECLRRLECYLRDARPALLGACDSPALWIGVRGERLHVQAAEVRLRAYSLQAGIRPAIAPHGLRRAMATHMLQHGADPLAIQAILGHASLTHLSRYLRLTITDIRRMHRESRLGE
ncbi:MAG: tyrosine-type recombinase/integrase [Lentisphaerae bacterium]|nr:tyrosine-type recombinase/integrase [Lentisphaerota bacterium]